MIKKILSWFKFNKYIEVVHRDPVSFEMDQLMKKNDKRKDTIFHTKFDERYFKKK